MRKVILQVATSVDNYIEGPNGEYDWCFADPDEDYGMTKFLERIDAIFFGRKSYEVALSAEGGLSWLPPVKEYIFSNTLKHVKEDAVLVSGDITAQVKAIKNEPGKDIWLFGGAALTATLMEAGLVDELMLAVHPILLGSGKPLFQDLKHRVPLQLKETIPYDSGLVMMVYEISSVHQL